MHVVPFVTAACLFILIVCLSNTQDPQDDDYQRGTPQKDITHHGHGDQMPAVKVPCVYSSFLLCF